jgi:hypothetical protein
LVGAAPSDSRVDHHTFAGNGSGSSGESRFEPDLDDGSGAGTAVSRNICAVGCQVRNDCYRAAGFSLEDNVVFGADATGDCNGGSIAADPQSAAAAADDCHPNNAAVAEPRPFADSSGAAASGVEITLGQPWPDSRVRHDEEPGR